MEDKKKWDEYTAKSQPAISQDKMETKDKININWRTLTGDRKELICSRTEFIWQAKKRFADRAFGEDFWKSVVPVWRSTVFLQNDKKISEYFDAEQDFVTVTSFGGIKDNVPSDDDGVSSASDDDEIMFL